jgi:4-hydroxythreonine-4-phosphate dehydrogenase
VLAHYAQLLGYPAPQAIAQPAAATQPGVLYEVPTGEAYAPQPGVVAPAAGGASFASLQAATDWVLADQAHALLTLPINKANIQQTGFRFPGHTEYLAERTQHPSLMLMCAPNGLRVALVTGHIPLRAVTATLTPQRIATKALALATSLRQDFGIAVPSLALLGVNPHNGDNGLLGDDEQHLFPPLFVPGGLASSPALRLAGPFAADGFFASQTWRAHHGVLAMYHDQGLVGFKSQDEGLGVNFTAGLPFVRTSPDHGTAYALAGTGQARLGSTAAALALAVTVARYRLGLPPASVFAPAFLP